MLPSNTILFLCDIQSKMGLAIYEFDAVVGTAVKMLKLAQLFQIPVVLTEQHPKGLGSTVSELQEQAASLSSLHLGTFEKKMFGMITPEIDELLRSPRLRDIQNVILGGVESHICIVQTALDLLKRNYNVFVLADGISSCNREEIAIATAEMRHAGVTVATSESLAFRLMGDANQPHFKTFSAIIQEEKKGTQKRLVQLTAGFQ